MKKQFTITLITVITLTSLLQLACRKSSATTTNCDQITTINSNQLAYDNAGRLVKEGIANYSYENNNKTIIHSYPGGRSRYQLDNNGCIIKNEAYDNLGKLLQSTTTVRDTKGYATDDVVEWYKADGSVSIRVVHNHTNTFDSNGDLSKRLTKTVGSSISTTTEYLYDNSKPGLAFIGGAYSLLVKEEPVSGRLLIKEKKDGIDHWGYTYTTDIKGRVIYNKLTPLISGATGTEATISYQCH